MKRKKGIENVEVYIDFPRCTRQLFNGVRYNDGFAKDSFLALKGITDYINNVLMIKNALWTIDSSHRFEPEKDKKQIGGLIPHNDYSIWKEQVLKYCDEAEILQVSMEFYDQPNKWLFNGIVSIKPSITWTSPMVGGKRSIRLTIEKLLWEALDRERFLNIIKKMCFQLNAYYVCIDKDSICPKSLYDSFYRDHSDNGYQFDPEHVVPGVFWLQFIPNSMLRGEEVVERIKSIKGIQVQDIEHFGRWIKVSNNIEDVSEGRRLLLRDALGDSIYLLSPTRLREDSFLPVIQEDYSRIPLTNNERLSRISGC